MKWKQPEPVIAFEDLAEQQHPTIARGRAELGLRPIERATPPIREVCFQYDERAHKFRPVLNSGSLLVHVDAFGRVVAGVVTIDSNPFAETQTLGFVCMVPSRSIDEDEVRAFLAGHAARRRGDAVARVREADYER